MVLCLCKSPPHPPSLPQDHRACYSPPPTPPPPCPLPHRKPLLVQAENFTLFIKNTVTFSKFNFSK